MKSVGDVLKKLEACPRAIKKYSDCYDFKGAFINCYYGDGGWIGSVLFGWNIRPRPHAVDYPNLPDTSKSRLARTVQAQVDGNRAGILFRKKANRIKYWPEVKKRLEELGFKIREPRKTKKRSDHKTRDARAAKKTSGGVPE